MRSARRSTALIAVIALLLTGALGATSCQRKVEVQTGEKVVCTYGHPISDDVRTIEVPADEASRYGVKTRTTTCADHLKAESTYLAAQTDIEKADLKAAAKKLAAVVAIDAAFKKAKAQLDEIEAGKTPEPDISGGSSGSTSGSNTDTTPDNPDSPDTPSGPIASLAGWMPDDISGYKAEKASADALYITRDYWPSSGSTSKRLVISAEQMLSAKAVTSAITAMVKRPYGKDGRAITVNGRSGYVGTNGRDTAVMGLADGPALVLFQLSSDKGDPEDLIDDLVTIAKTLPR